MDCPQTPIERSRKAWRRSDCVPVLQEPSPSAILEDQARGLGGGGDGTGGPPSGSLGSQARPLLVSDSPSGL